MRDHAASCGTTEAPTRRRSRRTTATAWSLGGSVVSGAAASACCWLPLVLLAFGVSAAGVGSFFETYRPYFVGSAVVLLALGFHLTYLRPAQYAPGTACAARNRKVYLFRQGMFWIAAALVAVFAFFPNYAGFVFTSSLSTTVAAGDDRLVEARFQIEGMTCEACAARVQSAVGEISGVVSADVDYEKKTAVVQLANVEPASLSDIVEAVRASGYRALVEDETP